MNEALFYSITGETLSLFEVIDKVRQFIAREPKSRYRIIIGTDSPAQKKVCFVSALTVWRIGNGGIYFWTRSPLLMCPTMRDRIYRETMYSITLAQEVRGKLKEKLGDEIFWDDQVHIDVGNNGPTRDLIDAVVGMVRGHGFDAVIKPYSFGASVVADRHT